MTINSNPTGPSYGNLVLTGASGSLVNGFPYPAWCIDSNVDVPLGGTLNTRIYCSTDNVLNQLPLPEGIPTATMTPGAPPPWDKINYILNKRAVWAVSGVPTPSGNTVPATVSDIQLALWMFVGGDNLPNGIASFAVLGFPASNSTVVDAIVADTIANGMGYVTPPGGIIAVVLALPASLNGGTPYQPFIIEVQCPAGLVGDTVFCDINRDGIQQAGEPGLQNVKLTLTGTTSNGGSVMLVTRTDANGRYMFTGISAGNYRVTVDPTTAPPGCNVIIPNCPLFRDFVLPEGGTYLAADFCFGRICLQATFDMTGNTALSGTFGNSRTFTVGGVSVKATAFSRTYGTGVWAPAYLGAYSGGLGVTDSSEGSGGNNSHTVDNIGRQNYVLFEFSQPVVLNRAYLGYVVQDSDLSLWIGTFPDPYNNHLNLNDAVLGSFGFNETNETASTTARWADVNAGEVVGNAIVIAASTGETTPEDQFKIQMLDVCSP